MEFINPQERKEKAKEKEAKINALVKKTNLTKEEIDAEKALKNKK